MTGDPLTNVLETKREAIVAACRRHGVARLEALGSAVRGDYRPGENDVDLLVELGPMEGYDRVDAYFGLLEDLRAILGQQVDLVMAGAVKNPFIARDIEQTKQMLYAA
jgi:uncharacterized protein